MAARIIHRHDGNDGNDGNDSNDSNDGNDGSDGSDGIKVFKTLCALYSHFLCVKRISIIDKRIPCQYTVHIKITGG